MSSSDFNDGGIRGKTPYILDRFDLEYMKGFDVVHSGNYSFTESELHKIKEAGIPVSFDFPMIPQKNIMKKRHRMLHMLFALLMEPMRRQKNI